MTYRVYYCLEGEPGIGHTLGPQTYNTPEDALAELYDLLRVEEILSVTVYTGRKMSRPQVMVSTRNLKETAGGYNRPRKQTPDDGRGARPLPGYRQVR